MEGRAIINIGNYIFNLDNISAIEYDEVKERLGVFDLGGSGFVISMSLLEWMDLIELLRTLNYLK